MAYWINTDWVPYGDTSVPMYSYECDEDCATCDRDMQLECDYCRHCEECKEPYHDSHNTCPNGCEDEVEEE